jgi:hypothetical protein
VSVWDRLFEPIKALDDITKLTADTRNRSQKRQTSRDTRGANRDSMSSAWRPAWAPGTWSPGRIRTCDVRLRSPYRASSIVGGKCLQVPNLLAGMRW